jgi:hypothetical protein
MLIMFKIHLKGIFTELKYSMLNRFMFYNIKVPANVFRNNVLFLYRYSKE